MVRRAERRLEIVAGCAWDARPDFLRRPKNASMVPGVANPGHANAQGRGALREPLRDITKEPAQSGIRHETQISGAGFDAPHSPAMPISQESYGARPSGFDSEDKRRTGLWAFHRQAVFQRANQNFQGILQMPIAFAARCVEGQLSEKPPRPGPPSAITNNKSSIPISSAGESPLVSDRVCAIYRS